jgi:hypothetical protein
MRGDHRRVDQNAVRQALARLDALDAAPITPPAAGARDGFA